MQKIARLAMVSAVLASPAMADDNHFQVVASHFFGDCGADGSAAIDVQDGIPVIELNFADFDVVATDPTAVAHRNCWAKITVQPDPGYQLSLQDLFYQGSANIDPSVPSAGSRISVRGYFPGQSGLDGIQSFPPGYSNNYEVHTTNGSAPYTACGQQSVLNLFASAIVYNRVGSGAPSDLSVDRGSGTTPAQGSPIVCGIQVQPCQ